MIESSHTVTRSTYLGITVALARFGMLPAIDSVVLAERDDR